VFVQQTPVSCLRLSPQQSFFDNGLMLIKDSQGRTGQNVTVSAVLQALRHYADRDNEAFVQELLHFVILYKAYFQITSAVILNPVHQFATSETVRRDLVSCRPI
jgi:hypothetical protein